MTRDEFLDGVLTRSGISLRYRTADGIKIGSFERVAVACPQAGSDHYHLGKPCSGWLLEKPAPLPAADRGGVYSVTTHT